MTISNFVIIWLSGWFLCCVGYIVSAIRKSKINSSRWDDHIQWIVLIFLSLFWPIVFAVSLWFSFYALRKRNQ